MVAMRNRIVHEYDHSDPDIVWRGATEGLEPVLAALERIVRVGNARPPVSGPTHLDRQGGEGEEPGAPAPGPGYSYRTASIGSIRAARRAGM